MKPHDAVFFIDRSLGKHAVAEPLRAAGVRVEIHDDHFAVDALDEHWLNEVGRRGWVVLTKDQRFQHRYPEIVAVAAAKTKVFQLTSGNLQGSEMAEIFVSALPHLQRFALGNKAPFIAKVSARGRVTLVYSARQLRKYAGARRS